MELTKEQLEAKCLYLVQENNALRAQLLDARVVSGEIRLVESEDE